MQAYIVRHARALYARARPQLGGNTCLYIITGCIKSDLWALAAYEEVEEGYGHGHIRLLQLSRTVVQTLDRPSSAYRWTLKPNGTHAEHGDSGTKGLKNQALFLQGFKLSFPECRTEDTLSDSSQDCPNTPGGHETQERSEGGSRGFSGDGAPTSSPGGGSGERNTGAAPGGVMNSSTKFNANPPLETLPSSVSGVHFTSLFELEILKEQ